MKPYKTIGLSVLILSALAFLAWIYIFPASESIHIDLDSFGIDFLNREVLKNKVTEGKKMEENYKIKAGQIFKDYLSLTDAGEAEKEQVAEIKAELLDLTVPAKFKDLHLNLVLAMSQMENFLESGDKEAQNISQELITDLKANYIWLDQQF